MGFGHRARQLWRWLVGCLRSHVGPCHSDTVLNVSSASSPGLRGPQAQVFHRRTGGEDPGRRFHRAGERPPPPLPPVQAGGAGSGGMCPLAPSCSPLWSLHVLVLAFSERDGHQQALRGCYPRPGSRAVLLGDIHLPPATQRVCSRARPSHSCLWLPPRPHPLGMGLVVG